MNTQKIAMLILIITSIIIFFTFNLGSYLSLSFFKSQQQTILAFYNASPWVAAMVYFALYVVVTGLSLPGATLMTLAGGAVFGFLWALVIVSFASTLGATLSFLVARFLLRESIQQRFGEKLKAINEGIRQDGSFYLFTLRLVPLFPFFMVNLVMGLTPIRTMTFTFVSQIGMLPGTIVFVNAGTQIAQLKSMEGILSLELLGSFALLGIFPLLAKKMVAILSARKKR